MKGIGEPTLVIKSRLTHVYPGSHTCTHASIMEYVLISMKCVYEAYLWRAILKRHVYCSSAMVFRTSLVLILAIFIRKLATSEKALAKRMSTALLPPHNHSPLGWGREYYLHHWDFAIWKTFDNQSGFLFSCWLSESYGIPVIKYVFVTNKSGRHVVRLLLPHLLHFVLLSGGTLWLWRCPVQQIDHRCIVS